jgi:hypothetical protein
MGNVKNTIRELGEALCNLKVAMAAHGTDPSSLDEYHDLVATLRTAVRHGLGAKAPDQIVNAGTNDLMFDVQNATLPELVAKVDETIARLRKAPWK